VGERREKTAEKRPDRPLSREGRTKKIASNNMGSLSKKEEKESLGLSQQRGGKKLRTDLRVPKDIEAKGGLPTEEKKNKNKKDAKRNSANQGNGKHQSS